MGGEGGEPPAQNEGVEEGGGIQEAHLGPPSDPSVPRSNHSARTGTEDSEGAGISPPLPPLRQ